MVRFKIQECATFCAAGRIGVVKVNILESRVLLFSLVTAVVFATFPFVAQPEAFRCIYI